MPTATFFLSTGRCGTQWLTEALQQALGERARVEHEPLHNDYAPRRMLGLSNPSLVGGRGARRMTDHVATIERTLETHDYIETGHPCWGALPWLIQRYHGRVRVVHLVRHPIPTACSWLSHRAFMPPLLPHIPEKELVTPMDPGVTFPEYRDRWATMSPYEKCLYYWAEVNALGLRLEREAGIPWLRITYEELFNPAAKAWPRLSEFVGAPAAAAQAVDRAQRVDQHRSVLETPPDVSQIAAHPRIVALAEEFGYDAGKDSRAEGQRTGRPSAGEPGRGS